METHLVSELSETEHCIEQLVKSDVPSLRVKVRLLTFNEEKEKKKGDDLLYGMDNNSLFEMNVEGNRKMVLVRQQPIAQMMM